MRGATHNFTYVGKPQERVRIVRYRVVGPQQTGALKHPRSNAANSDECHDAVVGSRNDDRDRRTAALTAIRRVRDRIDREYDRPLDVEELARGAYMSAGHLSREFKRVYGESPYSYLMTRRVERAMTLLRRGDMSVTEVCFAVGSSSLGTFSTRFTELVGVPPSVYQRGDVDELHGVPPCLAKQVARPVRNQEARTGHTT